MGKTTMLTIRVEEDVKELIESAATRLGRTISAFVLDAAVKAANRVKDEEPSKLSRGAKGVPVFFRTLCETAKEGGGTGYELSGRFLADIAEYLVPVGMSRAAWREHVKELTRISGLRLDEKVGAWFDLHLPECMALIPARRRQSFVKGAMSAVYRSEG
jgi:hypothetical protein